MGVPNLFALNDLYFNLLRDSSIITHICRLCTFTFCRIWNFSMSSTDQNYQINSLFTLGSSLQSLAKSHRRHGYTVLDLMICWDLCPFPYKTSPPGTYTQTPGDVICTFPYWTSINVSSLASLSAALKISYHRFVPRQVWKSGIALEPLLILIYELTAQLLYQFLGTRIQRFEGRRFLIPRTPVGDTTLLMTVPTCAGSRFALNYRETCVTLFSIDHSSKARALGEIAQLSWRRPPEGFLSLSTEYPRTSTREDT